ncbi:MAG: GNAT family N-acetyltransferase [Syntrophomonadaceae bacterium]
MEIRVEPYDKTQQGRWDDFVAASKNGTFLFNRSYMDYHAHRFQDCSLFIKDEKDKLIALLPANHRGSLLQSHGGLTYGGFVTGPNMTTPTMLAVFEAVLEHLVQAGFESLYYKTVPYIYHRLPAEEDRYALFMAGAEVCRRDVLSVVNQGVRVKYQERRRRAVKKAEKHGLEIRDGSDFDRFWPILADTLQSRFGVEPVHSLEEIELLHSRFVQNIKLYSTWSAEQMLAGVVVYESSQVAHVQYIAASPEGRSKGALDLLFDHLITSVYKDKRFFDFGISNEMEGYKLNVGLIEQKEGFGGRAVVHDYYHISLGQALQNLSRRVER